jgi:hypothetical protein
MAAFTVRSSASIRRAERTSICPRRRATARRFSDEERWFGHSPIVSTLNRLAAAHHPSQCQLLQTRGAGRGRTFSQVIGRRCPSSPKSGHTEATVSLRKSRGEDAAKGFCESFDPLARRGGETIRTREPGGPPPRCLVLLVACLRPNCGTVFCRYSRLIQFSCQGVVVQLLKRFFGRGSKPPVKIAEPSPSMNKKEIPHVRSTSARGFALYSVVCLGR